jgi:hypothetical protein
VINPVEHDLLKQIERLEAEIKALNEKYDYQRLTKKVKEQAQLIAQLNGRLLDLNSKYVELKFKAPPKCDIHLGIEAAFENWTLFDPYPELTARDRLESSTSKLQKFFGVNLHQSPRPEFSPHKAWWDGYQFAKSLVLKVLK